MTIREKLKTKRIYFDGGYGTALQRAGLKPGELPEIWNITKPDVIIDLHCQYLNAGCDILKTNTFGANRLKFNKNSGEYPLEEILISAIDNAKKAIKKVNCNEKKYIALDIGPTGKLLKPLGQLGFEESISIFKEIIKIGSENGVDLVLIETMNDSYETKAAVLACKEVCDLPIFVTNAYDNTMKLMTGADPCSMVALLEGLGVDALGINCSLGPDMMMPVIKELLKYSQTPVIVNPNAGLPVIKDGVTVYEISPDEFANSMKNIADMGVNILGGCCGTTPLHIKAVKENTKDIPYIPITKKDYTIVSSYTHSVIIDKKPVLIGERINPTGKPLFKNALRENNIDYILQEAISQQELGADILDVNVGLPEINEVDVLKKAVTEIQTVTDLPLQIDTTDIVAMEKALRVYNGKPLINSVSGKKEVMEEIFPLAKKYGGVIIALTLDENGIPNNADERIKIADKIIKCAKEYGIEQKDIIIDPLAMTISSDTTSALTTLECIKKIKNSGGKTSLGVSNVSFGLPQRSLINSTFFVMALSNGLNAAIMNPHSKEMMEAYYSFCALSNLDSQCEKYIEYTSDFKAEEKAVQTDENPEKTLKNAILKGMKEKAVTCAETLVLKKDALNIINDCIIPALDETGKGFESGNVFLPQLLMSAESAKGAFDVIKKSLLKNGEKRRKKYKIIIATVKGDIHDIGKNIVKVLLENYDFEVIDLGKDVPPEKIVETAIKENAKLVGLSALMTTTVPAMEETITLLKEKYPSCKSVVGGAVLTQEYADMIKADKYAKDAMEAVRYAETLI